MFDLDFVKQLREAFGFTETPKQERRKKTPRKILGLRVHPASYDAKRAEEMYRLRYIQKWTLQEIATKYGISRERVRQIIGNSGAGYKPERIKDEVQNHPELTNEELANLTGYSEERVSYFRPKTERHAIKEGSFLGLGTKAENIVSAKLTAEGIQNKLMPHRHVFDILLANGKTIDVKSRINRSIPPSAADHQHTPQWKFDCRKKTKGDYVDFFILYIWETGDFFVIPNYEVKECLIAFCWPPVDNGTRLWKSKWHQYHNRFDLLK